MKRHRHRRRHRLELLRYPALWVVFQRCEPVAVGAAEEQQPDRRLVLTEAISHGCRERAELIGSRYRVIDDQQYGPVDPADVSEVAGRCVFTDETSGPALFGQLVAKSRNTIALAELANQFAVDRADGIRMVVIPVVDDDTTHDSLPFPDRLAWSQASRSVYGAASESRTGARVAARQGSDDVVAGGSGLSADTGLLSPPTASRRAHRCGWRRRS